MVVIHVHDGASTQTWWPSWRRGVLDAAEGTFSEEKHPRDKGGKFAKKGTGHAGNIATLKKYGYVAHTGFPETEMYEHAATGHHFGLLPPGEAEHAAGTVQTKLKHLPPFGAKPVVLSSTKLDAYLTALHSGEDPKSALAVATKSPGEKKEKPAPEFEHPNAGMNSVLKDAGATPVKELTASQKYDLPNGMSLSVSTKPNTYGSLKWTLSKDGKEIGYNKGWLSLKSEIAKQNQPDHKSFVGPPGSGAEVKSFENGTTMKLKTGESVLVGKGGTWQMFGEGGGTQVIATGTGQAELNAEFEKLHPRGPGGKFAAKPGNEPTDENFAKLNNFAGVHDFKEDVNAGGMFAGKPFKTYKAPSGAQFEVMPSNGSWSIKNAGENGATFGEGLGHLANAIEASSGKSPQPATLSKPAIGAPVDVSVMKQVGSAKGSNPGGVYEATDGKRYYVKQTDEDHAKNEMLAGALYRLAGASTLDYHPLTDNKGLATQMVPLQADNVSQLSDEQKKVAQSDFAIHAWLANWDAVGLSGDNLGLHDGKPVNLDLGGSLLYRAKGAPKGPAFGNDPTEWDSLRDQYKNPQAAQLFGRMTPQQLKQSADRLKQVDNKAIEQMVMEHGPGDAAARESLAIKLMARKDAIIKMGDAVGGETSQPQSAAPPKEKEFHEKEPMTYSSLTAAAPHIDSTTQGALSNYKGSGYGRINDCMRFLADCDHVPQVKIIRDWLHSASIPEDTVLYRGIKGDYANKVMQQVGYAKGVGKEAVLEDPGFLSLTTSRDTAGGFSNGAARFVIRIPKGSKGASVHNDAENEVLFQQGTRLRVTGEKDAKGFYIAYLDQSHMKDE